MVLLYGASSSASFSEITSRRSTFNCWPSSPYLQVGLLRSSGRRRFGPTRPRAGLAILQLRAAQRIVDHDGPEVVRRDPGQYVQRVALRAVEELSRGVAIGPELLRALADSCPSSTASCPPPCSRRCRGRRSAARPHAGTCRSCRPARAATCDPDSRRRPAPSRYRYWRAPWRRQSAPPPIAALSSFVRLEGFALLDADRLHLRPLERPEDIARLLLATLRIVARAGRSGRAQERSVARGARRARMLVVVVDKQAAMTTKSGLENIPGSESCVRQFECLRGLYLEASA